MSQLWKVSASFSWDNFGHIRVYGLKPDGTIVEWQYDNGPWTGPQDLGVRATPGSDLAVVHTEDDRGVHIRVYYHSNNRIRELAYENGWSQGSVLP